MLAKTQINSQKFVTLKICTPKVSTHILFVEFRPLRYLFPYQQFLLTNPIPILLPYHAAVSYVINFA